MNEEALAHWGAVPPYKKKTTLHYITISLKWASSGGQYTADMAYAIFLSEKEYTTWLRFQGSQSSIDEDSWNIISTGK
jgi:hypothetical protein